MSADAALAVYAALAGAAEIETLRVLTCGSVDDGKSTLIGRLLYDSHLLMEDQLAELRRDSERHGTAGNDLDFALLLDGLEAEREQGITIDVAYRFFATPHRRFIVADTPGHVQYTRNMATGASTADVAVLLVDASRGITGQTRRHAVILHLLGVSRLVLAVNKMDLVKFAADTFHTIVAEFADFAGPLGFAEIAAIPLSARAGDNVTAASARTPWYDGPSLLAHLEGIEAAGSAAALPLRLPVQWVCRPDHTFRGFAGTLATGRLAVGDEVVVAASGRVALIASLTVAGQPATHAAAGDAVMVTLSEEVDVSRGDILVAPTARPQVCDQFAAHLVWTNDDPLLPGRRYLLKTGTRMVPAQVTELKHRINVDTQEHVAAKVLELNEIGFANLALSEPVAIDPFAENRATGSFILIDRFSNATVAAGMVAFPLRRAANVHWQALTVNRAGRAAAKHQKPTVLWFTGLSGAGKSTIANLVEAKLFARGHHTFLLDGDNVRHGLNRDLGFTNVDRVENIRRMGETAKLMADAGLIVLVSAISPFRSEREMVRSLLPEGDFVEVFVDAALELCAARDPKGLYSRARAGLIKNFTGIDSPYEIPHAPDLRLDTGALQPDEAADQVIACLERNERLIAALP